MTDKNQNKANNITLGKFSLIAVAMFGFGFALAPMYEAFCQAFGINGRFVEIQDGTYDSSNKVANITEVDKSRLVKVQFTASRNQNMNWEFKALESIVEVNPGEIRVVKFYAKNNTDKTVIAQAVPSVSPGRATKYLNKIECFCFTQQTFKPGEAREMPLRFVVDPALPGKISTLTLAYTFFDTQNRRASNMTDNSRETKLAVNSVVTNAQQ
ncbi:MAG: cytochrome c oxidase assembly protein [Gammaproteobacteria bacterium]|nr:cytochrome c oxidase assembly protein [Gammaproteobacteria bacterium]